MIISDAVKIIKSPLVRESLDRLINFPPSDKTKIKLIAPKKDESTLFAYSIEILIDFYFNRYSDLDQIFAKYAKPLDNFIKACEKQSEASRNDLFVFDNQNRFGYNTTPDYEHAESFSPELNVVSLSELEGKYISALNAIIGNINLKRPSIELYSAIIVIAKIHPTLRRCFISIKQFHQENADLINKIKLVHENLSDIFSNQYGSILQEPHLQFKHISCRPDFIAENSLIEIKCTSALLSKEHIRQVVFYYLASIFQEQSQNFNITRIQIYYPLYNFNFSIEIDQLIRADLLKSTIEELDRIINIK